LDLVLPASHLPGDPSVAEVVGARFGAQLLDGWLDRWSAG
jgi:hypothetical protein